jgi:hypothetical protein
MRVKARILVAATAVCLTVPAASARVTPSGPGPTSGELARQLVSIMAALRIDTIAAPDPAEPGRIVAAMSFPDVQLLVASARHKSFDHLSTLIAKRQFQPVYEAIQQGEPVSRLFFHDMGCDGFSSGEHVDIFYEGRTEKTLLDGNLAAQGLAEAGYAEKLKAAEEKYVHALTLLLDAAKQLGT